MRPSERSRRPLAGHLVWLAALAGCGGPTVDRDVVGMVEPVAVLTTEDDRAAGVHEHPLRPGERLLFVFDEPVAPVFTMDGVGYPLTLTALDDDGLPLSEHLMPACPGDCAEHPTSTPARYWVESRPVSHEGHTHEH